MHALEYYCFMQEHEHRRRGDRRTADIFKQLLGFVGEYIPETGEPASLLQLTDKVNAIYQHNVLCDEMLSFIRRKRRVTMAQLRTHFTAFESPDEEYPPPDFKVLRRVLVTLVKRNLIRRYGHGAYASVPARERFGPRPG
jgi:hypothetical protein